MYTKTTNFFHINKILKNSHIVFISVVIIIDIIVFYLHLYNWKKKNP